MKNVWTFVLIMGLALSSSAQRLDSTKEIGCGLSVSQSGVLLLEGVPYQGIGVNYFNGFIRTLEEGHYDDVSYRKGFAYLKERSIPFVRFSLHAYWPKDWKLYLHDRERYFKNLDAFVLTAEEYGIGLIPSFFWHTPALPDLLGEPTSSWGDTNSKTTAFMGQFVKEVVMRYRDSPAIWGWEQGNEVNLTVDLPGADAHLPAVVPHLGTPDRRTEADKLTTSHLKTMMVEFANEVRKYDSSRIIMSGNAIGRPSSYNLAEHGNWQLDSEGEYRQILATHNPDPLDVLSIHLYPGSGNDGYFGKTPIGLDLLIAESALAASQLGKPLILGEFGAPESEFGRGIAQQKLAELLQAIEKYNVPLSAIWVYDYPPHDIELEMNVGPDNGQREYVLTAIGELNQRFLHRRKKKYNK